MSISEQEIEIMQQKCTQEQRQAVSDFLKGCLKGMRSGEIARELNTSVQSINKAKNMLRYENGTYYTSTELIFKILSWKETPVTR